MSCVRWLIEALNPCIHQWEKIETLKDRPKNPTTVRIVQQCIVCGELRNTDIASPIPPPNPQPKCPPHKWRNIREIHVVKDMRSAKPDTVGYKYIQQCDHCGDTRTKFEGAVSPS